VRQRLELRDLRSLERRSMYAIFHPLDPQERLPRELILEARRFRWLSGGRLLTAVGAFYLPILILAVVVLGSLNISPTVAFGLAGVGLASVYVFALWAGRS
jgi:hypothetical protein